MPKKKIKVLLQNNEEDLKLEVNAIFMDNVLIYNESTTTKVKFYYNDNVLLRENNEIKMTYKFIKNSKSEGIIFLKDLQKTIVVDLYTTKIEKRANNITVNFLIENNKFLYRIEEIK